MEAAQARKAQLMHSRSLWSIQLMLMDSIRQEELSQGPSIVLVQGMSSTIPVPGFDSWLRYWVCDLEYIAHPSDLHIPHL